jgi:hypothetical protein
LIAELGEAAGRSGRPRSVKKQPIVDDELRKMAPLFTATWLLDALPKTLGLSRPTVCNSDGDEVMFHEVRFPLAPNAIPEEITDRLVAIPSLHRESATFWNWLDEPVGQPPNGTAVAENVLAWNVTNEDGRTVLGNVKLKERALIASVNSVARAERATVMLGAALEGLVAAPLTRIQTLDQMAQRDSRARPASGLPLEQQAGLVHAALDRQYRALLDRPVPMLGDLAPREAARTARGRDKLAVWLKQLENSCRRQPDPADPLAIYNFAWLWRELRVQHLRR